MDRMTSHRTDRLEAKTDLVLPDGFDYLPGYYDHVQQQALLADVRALLAAAPLFEQRMPKSGALLSVRMSNAGDVGWVTDKERGYRHEQKHPITGHKWPAIPESLLALWNVVSRGAQPPNMCLINYYDADARLGLHQDLGAKSLGAPVVSVSLGDDAVFVVGGLNRKDRTRPIWLHSGDVVAFGGPSRLIFHGVNGIKLHSSDLLAEGGRFNLTLRRIEK